MDIEYRLNFSVLPETHQTFNPRVLELETAKEIPKDVFPIRPVDMEYMIPRSVEENSWVCRAKLVTSSW